MSEKRETLNERYLRAGPVRQGKFTERVVFCGRYCEPEIEDIINELSMRGDTLVWKDNKSPYVDHQP